MKKKTVMTMVLIISFLACCFFPLEAFAQGGEDAIIKLLAPDFNRGKLLMQALRDRQSIRSFSPRALPLDVLSNLLWAANGINRPGSGKRTAPSAHDAREIDIYAAMSNGLYLYNPGENQLERILPQDIRGLAGRQDFTKEAPLALIYVANVNKLGQDKGSQNFYSATDTGFVSQNVYLFCASEGLATVILGWIDVEALSKAMGLKPGQRVILSQPVGFPK